MRRRKGTKGETIPDETAVVPDGAGDGFQAATVPWGGAAASSFEGPWTAYPEVQATTCGRSAPAAPAATDSFDVAAPEPKVSPVPAAAPAGAPPRSHHRGRWLLARAGELVTTLASVETASEALTALRALEDVVVGLRRYADRQLRRPEDGTVEREAPLAAPTPEPLPPAGWGETGVAEPAASGFGPPEIVGGGFAPATAAVPVGAPRHTGPVAAPAPAPAGGFGQSGPVMGPAPGGEAANVARPAGRACDAAMRSAALCELGRLSVREPDGPGPDHDRLSRAADEADQLRRFVLAGATAS
ncbi:MAG: hypothetical protein LBM66_02360 [Bifidobacteriaceae bacterium]|jgi:hypothetical protein|nr:hypothetical protein [Bifidobacteriaceae bacterium]